MSESRAMTDAQRMVMYERSATTFPRALWRATEQRRLGNIGHSDQTT